MSEVQFDIVETFGTISEEKSGWRKEFNLVAWNGRAPKYDIREWAPDHQKMGKGITMTKGEAEQLRNLLNAVLSDT